MPAKLIKISYPVPSNKNGHPFPSAEQLLSVLNGESSGLFLVGSEGMWHGGIHITDATVPWCALSSGTAAEQKYLAHRTPYQGEQPVRCMAEGKIVAWRVCKDYDGASIPWHRETLYLSTSFVLVEHYVQPGEKAGGGLTFHTLYMNMAPYEAYVSERGAKERKLAGSWRYYASAEDVLASPARPAGSLAKGTAVTLSDAIISRASDHRQFTQVTLSAETKNAQGEVLAAGTRLWTVSDRGALLAAAPSVPPPSWWMKCSPAYGHRVDPGVACTAHSILKYYLSNAEIAEGKNAGTLATGFPMIYEPDNAAQQYARPVKKQGDEQRTFSLVTLGRDVDSMKNGDRVWVVSDKDNLTVGATAVPGGKPVFGEVVIPSTPVAINAGDSIGHLGFYQLPTECESESRYQVHIECFSTGDGLPAFLTNPEKAGEDAPAFLKYPEGAKLFAKDGEEKLVDAKRLTRAPGILTLSGVPVIKEGDKTTHYRIRPEGGWLTAGNVKLLSQWALGELGFTTLDRKPQSFDLLDGVNPPKNVVQGILQELYKVAQAEPRISAALYKYNYKYLLDEIDQNKDGYYSEREYLQAVHLPSYRDHLYRLIAKHPSEWYYGKADELWVKYLDTLKKDVPEWKTYLEDFIDRLAWMKQVPGIGPDPWHMHPVVFLEALREKAQCACNRDITFAEMRVMVPGLNDNVTNETLGYLNQCFYKFGITTCRGKAHFISQLLHESGFLKYTSEIGGGSASYKPWYGRGFIQITLKVNYASYGKFVGEDVCSSDESRDKLTRLPDSMISAFWFYSIHKRLGGSAERDDFNEITAVINGGFNGYDKRLKIFKSVVEVLKGEHLNNLLESGFFDFESSGISKNKVYSLAWGLWHDPGNSRAGTLKSKEEAIIGYKKSRELTLLSPFPKNQGDKKIYGIAYGEVLNYIEGRLMVLGGKNDG